MPEKPKTFFIKTYGCQMNKSDSERIAAFLEKKGYKEAQTVKEADLVVINTCSVRQSAEDRVFGLVNNLSKSALHNQKPKIILTGCMLYHGGKWLKQKLPAVDKFIKTQDLLRNSQNPVRSSSTHAWVPIMEGCSHFCTYCVVPYARGPERSRSLQEIICEVKGLARKGYEEITLLGQNVNSYHPDDYSQLRHKNQTAFAVLLKRLHQIKGIKKISFITSNPWDLTEDIIEAMKLPKINRYLHLPVQSGDDEILKRMNRPYTAREYLKLVEKIRRAIPDIKIGTDIIVGFPGETKKAFENTVKLCKKVGFAKAYIAMYSPRPGTVAYNFKDDVPYKEKKRRWKILEDLINKKP